MVEIFFFLPVEVYFCFCFPIFPKYLLLQSNSLLFFSKCTMYDLAPCPLVSSISILFLSTMSCGRSVPTLPRLRNFYFCKYIYRAAVFVFGLCKNINIFCSSPIPILFITKHLSDNLRKKLPENEP